MTALPVLVDFMCAHPGCGAIRGFRCIYNGYTRGHPIRQQRVIETLDRRIKAAKSKSLIATLTEHREHMLRRFGRAPLATVTALATIDALAVAA